MGITDAQVASVSSFTAVSEEVCRRVLKDFNGDVNAASESLLLSGGKEIMCFTLPPGSSSGDSLRVQTPRGLVQV